MTTRPEDAMTRERPLYNHTFFADDDVGVGLDEFDTALSVWLAMQGVEYIPVANAMQTFNCTKEVIVSAAKRGWYTYLLGDECDPAETLCIGLDGV